MRLIDTDKLELKETVRIQLCGLKEYVALYSYTKEQIEEAPTVKAIPIEWIEKYIWSADTHEEKETLRKMYISWEKENEESLAE